jgi:N-sulfoglucosamine sulfohydrolase
VAQYYASCRRCDDTLGAALEALEASGLAERTLVMFLSDNGMAFPFAKTNCYLNSTRTPWLVRWPGVVGPGRAETERFVNGIDFAPTIAEVCGLEPLADIDGRSFAALLQDADAPGRDHLVTHINTIASKRSYPMRAVHTARFGYIFNAWSDGQTEFRNESMAGLTWPAMRQAGDAGDRQVAARVQMFRHRVPEELYDYDADPHALSNLADDPTFASAKQRLRQLLLEELRRSGDPLTEPFTARIQA